MRSILDEHVIPRPVQLVIVTISLLLASVCAQAAPSPNNLLAELPPQAFGVANAGRITDGTGTREGAFWLSEHSAHLASPEAYVDYDLGVPLALRCIWLQGDNNDEYLVSGSFDGQQFQPLWTAVAVAGAGLRLRHATINVTARYLRLSAQGGDGRYSVAEFGVAQQCPAEGSKAPFKRAWFLNEMETSRASLALATALLVLFVLLQRGAPRKFTWGLLAAALAATLWVAYHYFRHYPFFEGESALRAAVALIAGTIALREAFARPGQQSDRRMLTALLITLAVVAVGCYYHFGMPQFRDQAKGRRTLVHTFDMRHYFPVAKYFPELRFDGLYLASLAAYLDNTPGATLDRMNGVRLRDLKTNDMRYAPEVAAEVLAVRGRFTQTRWQEFTQDMLYLQRAMGDADYLGSMQDHGGNATPVWILGAWLLFHELPANEWTLSLAGLIDPALIVLLFFVVYRSFGLRVMLYSAILFGVTDFYNFGSNLMGSTLRQDWLVALGLGACALKNRRWVLGGGLLAYAGLIRAFPAMATFFLALPLLWWGLQQLRARRCPAWESLWQEQATTIRTGLGAVATVIALVAASSALFGWQGAWGNWLEKIEIHATGPSINNVGLRNVMSYDPALAAKHVLRRDHPEPWVEWQRTQQQTYAARRPLTYTIIAGVLLLAAFACRGREVHQVTLIGLLTIPFLFYPSNYYCHFIFLLPLALADAQTPARTFGWGIAVLCALCVGQYFSLFEHWSDLRYTWQSFMLLAACLLILLPLAWQGWRLPRESPVV
ncbi:MAG: hypothetical protein ACRETN_14285 [Nevskiales bacterium]